MRAALRGYPAGDGQCVAIGEKVSSLDVGDFRFRRATISEGAGQISRGQQCSRFLWREGDGQFTLVRYCEQAGIGDPQRVTADRFCADGIDFRLAPFEGGGVEDVSLIRGITSIAHFSAAVSDLAKTRAAGGPVGEEFPGSERWDEQQGGCHCVPPMPYKASPDGKRAGCRGQSGKGFQIKRQVTSGLEPLFGRLL